MIEMNLGLVADAAQVDSGGKLSILGEFSMIRALAVPARHPQFALVARWVAPESDLKGKPQTLTIDLVDEDGREVVPQSQGLPINFTPIENKYGKVQALLILQLNNLEFPRFGAYEFNFSINGVRAGSVELSVVPAK